VAQTLTPSAFRQQVASGLLARVYLMTGPDAGLKGELTALVADALDEGLRAFNLDRIHVSDSRPEARKQIWALIDLARTLPLMAPWRVIVVQGADKLDTALKKPDNSREEWEELAALKGLLAEPEPKTVLVFVTGADLDGRSKVAQAFAQHAVVVNCDPVGEAGDAGTWIRAEAARERVRIEPAAIRLLVSLAGEDTTRLRQEFERVLLFASGEGIITEAAVRAVAGSPDSGGVWAMTNALERGDVAAALRELALKLDQGDEPLMVLGQLGWFARTKLQPNRAPRAVEALFRTDLSIKTSRGDARVLLERLVVELSG
jgi:DNA polymerase III delta subunit